MDRQIVKKRQTGLGGQFVPLPEISVLGFGLWRADSVDFL